MDKSFGTTGTGNDGTKTARAVCGADLHAYLLWPCLADGGGINKQPARIPPLGCPVRQ